MDPVTIGLIASLAGSAIGGIGSARANKKYNKYFEGMQNKNQMWFDKEYNTNYLDTDEAKSYLRNILDQIKETTQDQESKGAITGASAEKGVAMKDRLSKDYNRSVTSLAGHGTRRKDNIMSHFRNREGQLDTMKLQQLMSRAQNWDQFGQNAQGVGQNMLMSNTTGAFDGIDLGGLFGGGNAGMTDQQRNATTVGMMNAFGNKGKAKKYEYSPLINW